MMVGPHEFPDVHGRRFFECCPRLFRLAEASPWAGKRRRRRGMKSKYGERVDTGLTLSAGPPGPARAQFAKRRKISEALVPPKPKELDSTTSISRLRAR